jgi:hypothetical protein
VAVIHAYDPEVVVFGGGVMQSADADLPRSSQPLISGVSRFLFGCRYI